MKKKHIYITLSLIISLFIYLFYRTDKTVVNEIIIRIISFETYTMLKANVPQFLPLNDVIIYSLPEGLWIFCITLTSKPYYLKLNNWRIKCIIIPLIYSVGLEISQLLHFTNGRFDFMDIWISVLFWLIGNYAFNEKYNMQNILMPMKFRNMVCLASYGIVYLSHVLK